MLKNDNRNPEHLYPGSKEAKEHGCTCAVNSKDNTFYIHENCPLHKWIYKKIERQKKWTKHTCIIAIANKSKRNN